MKSDIEIRREAKKENINKIAKKLGISGRYLECFGKNKAKINLNITLRSIESGIPQRVIDIMTAGGFVLTNYQEEVSELFDEDKEIVTFSCLDEYRDKAHYYIAHEEERAAIAAAGLKKVREEYNITKLVEKMLTQVGLL